ncbi:hypothetical protein [Verrucomicrobium spinosum]|nr:hypothetical protein [Verrucomicrobium spinosum]
MLFSLVIRRPVETAWGAATLVVGVVIYFLDRAGRRPEPGAES